MTGGATLLLMKLAAKKKGKAVKFVAPKIETFDPLANWHPEWAPDVGWKSEDNPAGWIRPSRVNQVKELYLFDQWKKNDHAPEYTQPLIKALTPIIHRYGAGTFLGRTPIADEILISKAEGLVVEGLQKKFDPSKGQISTFLSNNPLRGMQRFTQNRQNMTRISTTRIGLIGKMKRARSDLQERLGREPTLSELADEMKVSQKTIGKLLEENRADRIGSMAVNEQDNPFIEETPEAKLKLDLIQFSLTPNEQLVFDHLTGKNGKPLITKPGQVAKKLGWSGSKVSEITKSITAKWEGRK